MQCHVTILLIDTTGTTYAFYGIDKTKGTYEYIAKKYKIPLVQNTITAAHNPFRIPKQQQQWRRTRQLAFINCSKVVPVAYAPPQNTGPILVASTGTIYSARHQHHPVNL